MSSTLAEDQQNVPKNAFRILLTGFGVSLLGVRRRNIYQLLALLSLQRKPFMACCEASA